VTKRSEPTEHARSGDLMASDLMATVAPPRAARGTAAPSPPARRAQRPRWRDTRLLIGVLLILLSVVIGARVVAGAASSGSWVTVTSALPAGHVLTDADFGTAMARLDDAASAHYYRANSRGGLLGRPLAVAVGAGALLPSDAVAPAAAAETRVVPVLVHAGRLPALRPGDHVDVYALVKGAAAGADREVLVVRDVEFLTGESLGSGDTSAQLRVAVPDAIRVVAASQSERVDLVRVDGLSGAPAPGGPAPAVPTEAPGLGG
jgi:hypothetical protein